MLRNETYTGRLIWNRTHFVKRPGTNKRVPRERPRREWTILDRPELRIVSAELWRGDRSHRSFKFPLGCPTGARTRTESACAKTTAAARGTVQQHPDNIREFVTTRLANLLGLLNVDTVRARAELAKHTTEIRMIPEASPDGKLKYVAEGEWNFFGGADFAVVAGVGFEPTTFGL